MGRAWEHVAKAVQCAASAAERTLVWWGCAIVPRLIGRRWRAAVTTWGDVSRGPNAKLLLLGRRCLRCRGNAAAAMHLVPLLRGPNPMSVSLGHRQVQHNHHATENGRRSWAHAGLMNESSYERT
jgi:hypothetical protein